MHRQLPALTGIRGVAAIWVVLFHAYPLFAPLFAAPERGQVPVVREGFLAVDLFFVLSGFVLGLAYHDRFRADLRSGLGEFLVHRVCRILPLHWVCLAAFVLLLAWFPHHWWGPGPFTPDALIASATLIQNWTSGTALAWNHPTWSLSAEFLAYLLFPVLIVAVGRQCGHWLALPGALLCLVLLDTFLWRIGSATLNHVGQAGLVRCLCEFSAGVLAWKALGPGARASRALGEGCVVLGVALLLFAMAVPEIQMVASLGCVALITGCALPGRIAGVLLGNRLAVFLGTISFSLYLCHIMVLGGLSIVLEQAGPTGVGSPVRLAVVLVFPLLLLGVATLTWWFVERPCQAYARVHARHVTERALAWFDSLESRLRRRGLPTAAAAVPAMTIVAATLGETAGDLLSTTLHFGYVGGTIILMAVFVATLLPRVTDHARRDTVLLHWSVILSMCAVTTTLWDSLARSAGLHYIGASFLLISGLVIVLAGWRWMPGPMASVLASRRVSSGRVASVFFSIAILLLITLSTGGADFLTERCGLGYVDGAMILGGVLVCAMATALFMKLPAGRLFWLSVLLARPFGVALGDILTKPYARGGLQLGTAIPSLGLAAVLIILLLAGRPGGGDGAVASGPCGFGGFATRYS